jgi:hypothetical protein
MITLEQVETRKAEIIAELTELENRYIGRKADMIEAYYARVSTYNVFDQAIDALIRLELADKNRDILDEILNVTGKLWVEKLNALDCDPLTTPAKGFKWPDDWVQN